VGSKIIREQMNVEASTPSAVRGSRRHIITRLGLSHVRESKVAGEMNASTPAIVLGGTGYVAGELLRLIAGHPQLDVAAILSDSQPGAPVAGAFAHLRSAYPELKFADLDEIEALIRRTPRCALFSAAPHGVAAAIVDRLLTAAEAAGSRLHCVDISADFRYSSSAAYEAVYKHAHGAPARIREFTCAVPEHLQKSPTPHVAHPGCFATATLLACVPLLALGLTDMRLFVTGITGSTGSGRKPIEGTHQSASAQRSLHLRRLEAIGTCRKFIACAKLATGVEAELNFVPHSGPFAARHTCHRAGQPQENLWARRRRWKRSNPTTRIALRARGRQRASGQGCGDQQLCEFERGDQREFHCGQCRWSTISTKAPPAAPFNG